MDDNTKFTLEAIHFHYGKIIRWLIIGWVLSVLLICGMFLYERSQYVTLDTEDTQTVEVDGENGTANYIGNDGDIVNGEGNSYTPQTDTGSSAEETQG